ncbi:MAG: hypothetical protein ABDH59_01810 [Fervidobacterium sp.]
MGRFAISAGVFVLAVISIVAFQSCMKSAELNQPLKALDIKVSQVGKVGEIIDMMIETLEPGIPKIFLSIESSDTKITELLKSYPYKFSWKPEKPGIYKVEAKGFSVVDGKTYVDQKQVIVYDSSPPYIEKISVIPNKLYEGDEVLLQLKIGSNNPKIDLTANGLLVDSPSTTNTQVSPGYNFIRLGRVQKNGLIQLFVRTKAYDTQDSTTLILQVNRIDRVPPEITVSADTFYSPESNITLRVTLKDNVELYKFRITFDGEAVVERNISGTIYTEEISIGKKDTGTHAINVVAYDKEGNMYTFAKRIYVGGAALRFKIELSPSELTTGRTAVIAMIPEEKDVKYSKITYLVDGKRIAEYPNENVKNPQLFTLWEVEEGEHYITIYAESEDGRAGIAESTISVRDYNGPKFVSLYANSVELKLGQDNFVSPGLITFKLTVEDPGGISLTTKPRLLIKEDESEGFYRDLVMDVFEVSSDLRRVTFAVSTYVAVGYYYLSIMNVADRSGNLMRDIGKFLIYAQ